MKRDFSTATYEALCAQVREIRNEQLSLVTDWLGDRYLQAKHMLGKFGLVDYMGDMERYHKEVLDMENTTMDELKTIFENVSALDDSFANGGSPSFSDVAEDLQTLRELMRNLSTVCTDTVKKLVGGAIIGGGLTVVGGGAVTGGGTGQELPPIEEVDYTSATFGELSEEDKRRSVEAYEAKHAQEAMLMDEVLSDSDLTEQERLDIRFILYNAPEPYRTIYLEHLRKYKVSVDPQTKGAFYQSGTETIHIRRNSKYFRADSCGPYTTFFHESGHAIDDFEDDRRYLTGSFTYEGESLHALLTDDVRSYVEDYINSDPELRELTEAQRQELLRSLNLTDDASYLYGTGKALSDPVLEASRQRVLDYMHQDLSGADNACASDVYGGVTNNAINGDWGHYNDRGDPRDSSYWYYGTTATGMQEKELWAEFFAAKMTRNEEALASIRAHFPRAYEAMEAMAEQMAATT